MLTRSFTAASCLAKLFMLAIVVSGLIVSVQAQTETILHNFDVSDEGFTTAGLTGDGQGNFYGGAGTVVFKIDAAGNYSTIHSFQYLTGEVFPTISSLVLDNQGNLYGDAYNDSTDFADFLQTFQITPAGNFKILAPIGASPIPQIQIPGAVLDANKNVYVISGPSLSETNISIDKISPSGTVTTVHTFTDAGMGLVGLSIDSMGNLYSISVNQAPPHQCCNRYRIDKTMASEHTKTVHIVADRHTENPPSFLGVGAKDNLYGMTGEGGTDNNGTVFLLTPAGQYKTLFSFNGANGSLANDSGILAGAPVQDAAGNLYGATPSGGGHGMGTVFRLSPEGVLTTLYNFGDSASDGAFPNGVVLDQYGNLYGTTLEGGANNMGVVFKITM